MAGSLDGRVALITGGGTGIGLGIAEAFAGQGAAVAISGRRPEVLDAAVRRLQQSGARTLAIAGDVSQSADCKRMVDQTVRAFGGLHILVNNAGIFRYARLDQMPDQEIEELLDIDLKGPLFLIRAAYPHLAKHKQTGGASILNISTSATLTAVERMDVYAAAKAGLNHLTLCLAKQYGTDQIRVNAILPGVVETPIFDGLGPQAARARALEQFQSLHPLGRVGRPQDVAAMALFLSGPGASWVTGALVAVDGGLGLG